jgi:ATP-dependent Clp protease, protease subunit
MTTPPPALQDIFIILVGEVNHQMCVRVFSAFVELAKRAKTIHLLVQSYGGSIGDGIALYNFIRYLPVEVITYNGGIVASIAVPIYMAGRRRKSSENATFVIHKAHHVATSGTAEDFQAITDGLRLEDTRVEKILKDCLTLSEEQWKIHERGNLTLTAQAALGTGLIHEIGDFKPTSPEQLFTIVST